jgi:hypothetical protein
LASNESNMSAVCCNEDSAVWRSDCTLTSSGSECSTNGRFFARRAAALKNRLDEEEVEDGYKAAAAIPLLADGADPFGAVPHGLVGKVLPSNARETLPPSSAAGPAEPGEL